MFIGIAKKAQRNAKGKDTKVSEAQGESLLQLTEIKNYSKLEGI
jgi:hypothetical protein